MIIQIANASMTADHTQLSTACTEEPNATRRRPPNPMSSAGATAHRCGWSVNLTESTANITQPTANPHSTAPVTRLSSAGRNGAATRSRATTNPTAIDPDTIQPMCLLGPRSGRDGRCPPLSLGVGMGVAVFVTTNSIPCPVAFRG